MRPRAMRMHFIGLPGLPRHPLLRALAIAASVIVAAALLAVGLVVGVAALLVVVLTITLRQWRARRAQHTTDTTVIEGEFTIVADPSPAQLQRPD